MTILMTMPTVPKAVLKARLLEYLRAVEESGEPIIVTSYGTVSYTHLTLPTN